MTNNISYTVTSKELCHNQGISHETIVEIIEYGIAKPLDAEQYDEWTFDLDSAYWIKKALKINRELHIDWVATSMVISLIRKNNMLEQKNAQLQQLLDRLL
ncbi:chaperone modulator CbpM [Glaciecola sp. SC05]|uniref:chaperone modulator CbpM n=1 Tax=Glaciecola sp. SC05 TaxID=1987355 RepID=UPI003526FAFD